jgi:PBP1b-binding outer membrane lipoprotein LpoB
MSKKIVYIVAASALLMLAGCSKATAPATQAESVNASAPADMPTDEMSASDDGMTSDSTGSAPPPPPAAAPARSASDTPSYSPPED